jgi:hypothetical protein
MIPANLNLLRPGLWRTLHLVFARWEFYCVLSPPPSSFPYSQSQHLKDFAVIEIVSPCRRRVLPHPDGLYCDVHLYSSLSSMIKLNSASSTQFHIESEHLWANHNKSITCWRKVPEAIEPSHVHRCHSFRPRLLFLTWKKRTNKQINNNIGYFFMQYELREAIRMRFSQSVIYR